MAYQVLARKYRPKDFSQVVGQDHIVTSLKSSVSAKKIGGAYLFCGTRGVGKTTLARVFSKAILCPKTTSGNPCGVCETCEQIEKSTHLDVQEIDGASNNSVENVRSLIENIGYLPMSGEYKIYIIDEVHMLSQSAFNALLKTLEEPPAHIIFILATTDPEKLPHTVLSRCLRLDFKHVNEVVITNHLKNILKKENISFKNESDLNHIGREARGSIRDSLSYLDQVLCFSKDNEVSEEAVIQGLGKARTSSLQGLIEAIITCNTKEVVNHYSSMINENVAPDKMSLEVLDLIFKIIQNIDEQKQLEELKALKNPAVLNDVSTPELFWIYEEIAKNVDWIIKSLNPSSSLLVLFNKISRRREFFGNTEKLEVNEDKENNLETVEKEEEVKVDERALIEERIKEIEEKKSSEGDVWHQFINSLQKSQPVLASNLEQGNLLEGIQREEQSLNVKIGFKNSSEIFYDYLSEVESKKKLRKSLADYFSLAEDMVHFELKLIDPKKKDFSSKREEKEKLETEVLELQKEKLLKDPVVLEAERVFGVKVDRVVLNENNNK